MAAPTPYDNRLSEIDERDYRGQWGANFRRLREAKFRYQTTFAEELRKHGLTISKQSISNWEHGWRLPIEVNDYPIIAAVLGVEVSDLWPKYVPQRSKPKPRKKKK